MNILLLNPPYINGKKIFMKEIGRCGSTATANQYWPQTGLAYLAANVQSSHNIKIIDAIAQEYNFNNLITIIKNFRPKVIVIHTTTPTFNNDATVLNRIKKELKNTIIGFVGNHVSNTVKPSLQNSIADFILVNEPELTFQDLIINLSNDWKKIPGLAYRKSQKIIINKPRKNLKNLDNLNFPARNLLHNNKYKMILTNNEVFATVIPSRGCPFSCIFCRVGYPWGKKFRQRSVDNVLDEIKEIRTKYSIRNIVFMADTFTLEKKWVMDLCNKILQNKLDINWLCNSRADTIDQEMVNVMKKAGCSLISFGIESGNQQILDKSKKNLDLRKAKHVINITKKQGIRTFAYFILGLPGENKKTINQTIKFAKKLDPDYVNFHLATPHPGTELATIAHKKKWIIDNQYEHYDQSGKYSVLKTNNLSSKQILRAQKRAMREFYLRPKIILKQLIRIKKPKDIINLAKMSIRIMLD